MAIKNLGKVVPQKGVDYFTEEDISSLNIPKNISELTNDSSYATETYVKNQIANAQLGGEGGEVDLSGYATKDELHSHSNKDVLDSITQENINKWNNNSGGGSGLTTEQINALNEMFKVCAYIKEDVSAEYGAFKNAFGIDGGTVPTKTLQSISATYTGGNVEVGTNVNTLTGITVKANYSDGTSTNVTGYTLSGTIEEGSNIITVTYQGLTTTFAVTGVAEETGGEETTKTLQSISATYTGGNVTVGTSVNSLTGITVKANYSDGSQENVIGYTLSGNIVEGNNTIIVTYEGLTTTFIVVGIAEISDVEDGDTTAKIAEYGVGLDKNGSTSNTNTQDLCITEFYDIPEDYKGMVSGLIPYSEDNMPTYSSQNTYYQLWYNETFKTYWQIANLAKPIGSTEGNSGLYYASASPVNKVRFTLFKDYIDDAYIYLTDTGEILFAGKNTPYYGKSNISEV